MKRNSEQLYLGNQLRMVNVQPENVISNRYILKDKIAEGGMGVVYMAMDRLTGDTVALKQVKLPLDSYGDSVATTLSDSFDEKNSLAQEFRAIASIRHPNIISVLDYGFLSDGSPFFTMDYLDNFQDFFRGGVKLTTVEKVELLIELLHTLEYLHRRGLLHRDIKPGNVAIYKDSVKLLDFGLSVDAEAVQTDNSGDEIVGTLAYMAPEVLQGEKATASSDLYAVGVMAYELFVGSHPFDMSNISTLIMHVISTEPDFSSFDTIQIDYSSSNLDTVKIRADEATTEIDPTLIFEDEDLDTIEKPTTVTSDTVLGDNPLRAIIQQLLAKSSDTRYTNAIDAVHDLNTALDRTEIQQSDRVRESYLQSARFVGRDTEISILQDALEETARGNGTAWLMRGEHGVGKSRLVDELRVYALIKGYRTVRGHSVADNNIPYQLWREPVLRMLLNTHISDIDASVLKEIVDDDDIERLLDKTLEDPEPLDGDEHRERLQAAILSLFQNIRAPLLLILEDIQWSPDSIDTLNRLASIIQDKRIIVIATYRHDEGVQLAEQMPDFNVLQLNRLGRDEVKVLGESIVGSSDNFDQIIDALYEETDGNVYFMIEILRELSMQSGSLDTIDVEQLQSDISNDGIKQILLGRLKRLSDNARRLLKIMALAGKDIDLEIIEKIDTDVDLDAWFVTCSNLSILDTSEDGDWRFVHDAMRRTVIDAIDEAENKALHHAVAEAVEAVYSDQVEYANILASHWRYAENLDKEQHYARLAADYALHIGNSQDARELYERLLEIMPTESDDKVVLSARADVEIGLCKTLYYLGEYDSALNIIVDTVARLRAGDASKQLVDGLLAYAEVLKRQGNLPQSETLVAEALVIATTLDYKKSMTYALDRLSDLRYEQGDYEQASKYSNDGLALAIETDDKNAQGSLFNNLGLIAFSQGNTEDAGINFNKAHEIYTESGQVRATAVLDMNLGSVSGQAGDLDTCLSYFERALNTFKSIGEKRLLSRIYSNLGFVASLKDDHLSSINYYNDGLKIAREIGSPVEISLILCNLGDARRNLGDVAQARVNFIEAVRITYEATATQAALSSLSRYLTVIDDPNDTLVFIGHILNNSASNQETLEKTNAVLEQLKADKPALDTEARLAQGQALSLDEVVQKALEL